MSEQKQANLRPDGDSGEPQGSPADPGPQPCPETGGIGVLLDEAVAGVALAGGWQGVTYGRVILGGRRAYATDGFRLHTADLPIASPAVHPPLQLQAARLRFALQDLARGKLAEIIAMSGNEATLRVPRQDGGDLLIGVPIVRDPAPLIGLERYARQPDLVLTVEARYLRDALDALLEGAWWEQPATLIAWRNHGAVALVAEHEGRQRAALIAARRDGPVYPWWWTGSRRGRGHDE